MTVFKGSKMLKEMKMLKGMKMLKAMRNGSAYLVSSIASEASQGTLNSASCRVNIRLESRRLVIRHVW